MNAASNSAPIVLATGGTGGHVFPAEALAGELAARGHSLALITDKRGRQWRGALANFPVHAIHATSPSGGIAGKLRGVVDLGRGFFEARSVLRKLAPAAAVGFGGYASVPGMMAATFSGIPTVLHEQNAVLGRANRLLAGRVDRIATAFAQVEHVATGRATLVGNPVRDEVRALYGRGYVPPSPTGAINILITGGSQGATVFSKVLPEALSQMAPVLRSRLRIVQQCRSEDLEAVKSAYAALGIEAELASFFADIPALLAGAHLVLARAGASTVAELTASGRPSILVPYPHATDDHQTANARAIDEVGACIRIANAEFTASRLAGLLAELAGDPQRLARMAGAAHALGRPDAAQRLADLVEQVLRKAPAAPLVAGGAA
jgi:UDP-N-acetylglucosamine--N-acetylmuramyl-(pentapeptide) pyrophosphoryl-undecaprenol N-acetylglucosamine transferase